MQVVEGGEQAGVGREQHAVAEDVAAHVADADGGEGVVLLDVFAEQAEVALDGFPGAARGDADAFVVVTRAAAGGEGVAEPEAVFGGDLVGDVGEFGGAFVGGDDEVGVVFVMAHGVSGRDDFAFDEVVGEIEQAADEGAVAGFARFHEGVAVGRRVFDDEAAFGADRHDDGVFHHLRFDQPQHFGAEIGVAIRPAQAAARHFAAAQVHAFHFGRIDPDFVERFGFGEAGDVACGEFEGEAVFRLTVGVFLVVVSAQQGGEEVKIPAQDGFVFGALYLLQTVLQFAECGGGVARLRPHFGVEGGDERGGGIRVGVERGADLFVVVGRARLHHVFAQRAQHGDFADVERGCEQERVQAVAVCSVRPDAAEGVSQAAFHRFRRDGGGQGECVLLQPVVRRDGVRLHAFDGEADVFQQRQDTAQAGRLAVAVEFELQLACIRAARQFERKRRFGGQRLQGLRVGDTVFRREGVAVGEGKGFGKWRERRCIRCLCEARAPVAEGL